MKILRVLVPHPSEQWFIGQFPGAIKKRRFISDELDYVEYFLLNFSEEDIEIVKYYNLFWKIEDGPKNFYD